MLTVRVLAAIREVPREAWDALLVPGASPFVEWTWLDALEEAGTVGGETGWLPHHLTLWDGARLVGACPLYRKTHSQGEFVFDFAWAHAARRSGLRYYPKLLVGVPFTPVAGPRLLARPAEYPEVAGSLGAVLEELCRRDGFSSVHVNFCSATDVATLAARGWLPRIAYQYHWRNAGFGSFEDYLASLRSKRRNQVRREQRALAEQGIGVEVLVGDDVPAALVPVMFRLYRHHVRQFGPWGHAYLNRRFFELLWERLRPRLCVVVARRGHDIVGGSLNVVGDDALYGRYWGAFEPVPYLHFNVCYYAGIAHCIATGLRRFEAGAGGEFKHLRAFDARITESVHFIADPGLRRAVAAYLRQERAVVTAEIEVLEAHTARRRGTDAAAGRSRAGEQEPA